MASSGSFNTNSYSGRYLNFSWSISSQSVANNQTTISWTLKGAGTASSSWYYSGNFKVVIDGTTVYSSSTRIKLYNGTTVASGSYTMTHDSSGNKSFSASAQAGIYTVAVNCTGSGSWSLTQIPRKATISSAPNFNDTANPTITYSNPAGSSVSSLQACISLTGSTDDIAYRSISTSGTSYTFNLTTAERNVLLAAASSSNTLSVRFYVKTVIGGTTYLSYLTRTMTVTSANPTISSVAYADTNSSTIAITGNNQYIVRNKSTLVFTLSTIKSLKYATLVSAKVTVNGVTKSVTLSGTSVSSTTISFGTINVSSNVNASIVITDSRGNTTTVTKAITVLDYSSPYATITLQRQNNFYTATDFNVNATYSSLNGGNSLTIEYFTKKVSESSYGSETTIENNTDYTISLDNNYQWNVKVVLTDTIGTTVSYVLFVDRGLPIIYFDRLLSSTGFNCFPTEEDTVEINGIDIYNTLFFKSGDTFEIGGTNSQSALIVGGIVSNSVKNLHFSVTLPKYLNNISSITVTELGLNPRICDGGYLNASSYVSGGNDFLTDFTVSAKIVDNNKITITVTSTTAYTNAVNNTPVGVEIDKMTLSFT